MKNRMKLCLVGIGTICLVCFFLFGPGQTGTKSVDKYEYSEKYVQIKELYGLLDFYYYTSKEWEEKIKEQDFGEILTPKAVAWVLEQTGSTEYIRTIDRAGWNEIYMQLLDLLDEGAAIQKTDEVILKQEGKTLFCGSGSYELALDELPVEPMTAMGVYIKDNHRSPQLKK